MIHQEVTPESEFKAGEAFCHTLNGTVSAKTCQSGKTGYKGRGFVFVCPSNFN